MGQWYPPTWTYIFYVGFCSVIIIGMHKDMYVQVILVKLIIALQTGILGVKDGLLCIFKRNVVELFNILFSMASQY